MNENMNDGLRESQEENFTQLTQCMDELEDTQDAFTQSQSQQVTDPEPIGPWGRLVPQGSGYDNYELLPKSPLDNVGSATRSRSVTARTCAAATPATATSTMRDLDRKSTPQNTNTNSQAFTWTNNQNSSDLLISPQNQGINFIGLQNIRPFDRFNEYIIGRSQKCDVVAPKTMPKSEDPDGFDANKLLRNTIHSMISNTHCRMFCLLKSNTSTGVNNLMPEMEVHIEDSSGNGTFVNNTIMLKRNERRILHTGDTICLLNPKIVRKKVKNVTLQKELLDTYSFVFINIYQTHSAGHPRHQDARGGDRKSASARTPIAARIGMLTGLHTPASNNSRKRALVDVRSTKSNSIQRHGLISTPTAAVSSIASAKKNIYATMGMMPPPEKKRRSSSADLMKKTTSQKRIEQEYDLRDEIGQGMCGTVRRAIHRISGNMVAVKVIAIGNAGGMNRTLSKISKEGVLDPNIQAEASILQSLNHPYIVKLLDLFIDPGKAVYIVMELLHGGDLFDRIVQKSRYSEVESKRVMRRILAAVHYLHQDRDIVHRDLKPENVLLVSRNDDITVKLTDFGLAKSITEDGLKTFCGTPQYFAPEVLRRRTTVAGRGRYGKEADIWSLGVILYILICGAPPFDATMDSSASTRISFGGPIWKTTSKSAIDLITKMLTADPSKRISVVDACSHEWIMTPDGDTHVHPLDDQVLLEAIQKKTISSNEESQTPPRKPSPETPQSVLGTASAANRNACKSTPPQSITEKTTESSREASSKVEALSPDQSAMFPTPIRNTANAKQSETSRKRESLFSSVKHLSKVEDGRAGKDNNGAAKVPAADKDEKPTDNQKLPDFSH